MTENLLQTKAYARIRDTQISIFENYARKHGMQSKSMLILMWIYYNPEGITQQRITLKTYSTKQVVNATIKTFKDKGYLLFEDGTADRRTKLLKLTDAGKAYAASVLDTLEQAEYEAMNELTPEEREVLLQLSEKYTDALTKRIEKVSEAEADKEKLRANLLRAVSHDLRTPLTSIIGSSSSYLENGSDMTEYERTELVSNIKEDSEWLLNMVENLLTITRIDNNSQDKVKKSPEVVEEVVSEAIQRLRKRLSDVRIKVHMPNDFLMIPMDATLIEQVLINLLENASVHSESTEEIDLIITQTKECVSFFCP